MKCLDIESSMCYTTSVPNTGGDTMTISNNDELRAAVNDLIETSGYKKTFLSEKLGIANQNFNRILKKNNFSLDDANKILSLLGYQAEIKIIKKD